MSEENPQQAATKPTGRRRGERDQPGRPKEMCICGHSASKHTAYRYTCQAAGDRKGFCPCMRFVSRNSAIGKKTRAASPSEPQAETTENTPASE